LTTILPELGPGKGHIRSIISEDYWPKGSLRKCEGGSLSERELGGEGAGMQKSSLTL